MPQEGKNNAFESSKNAPVHLEGFLAEFRLAIQEDGCHTDRWPLKGRYHHRRPQCHLRGLLGNSC